jgi:hypothetical protein
MKIVLLIKSQRLNFSWHTSKSRCYAYGFISFTFIEEWGKGAGGPQIFRTNFEFKFNIHITLLFAVSMTLLG